jgi:hypothetical protein
MVTQITWPRKRFVKVFTSRSNPHKRPHMPHSARLPGPSRAVMAAGGSACARVPARRSASGGRYRSAMCQARSAGSAAGVPAAVTNYGPTGIRARPARRGWPYGTGTWPRRSPGCRTRRLARLARPRLDRHAGDLAGSRRREPGAIAVACATGRFRRINGASAGSSPEHRGQSSCSRRHANA